MKNFERLIPITIREAKIQRISIDYREMKLGFCVDVGLITDDKQILTSISINSNDWNEEKKLSVPIEVSDLAGQLESVFKIAVSQHMNKFQKKLGDVNADS